MAIELPDEFDAPETPEEQAETKRLLHGLKEFPLGGQMRSGEEPTAIEPELELTNTEMSYVISCRGGCRCLDPGARPPCNACSEPLNEEEIEMVKDMRRDHMTYWEEYRDLTAKLFGQPGQMIQKVWENTTIDAQEDHLRQLRKALDDKREREANQPAGWGAW